MIFFHKVHKQCDIQDLSTLGSWLLQFSVVRFSLVAILQKLPKYPAYAIFTT